MPIAIQSQRQYNRLDAGIGRLIKRGACNLTFEEQDLLELMTKLIEFRDYQI